MPKARCPVTARGAEMQTISARSSFGTWGSLGWEKISVMTGRRAGMFTHCCVKAPPPNVSANIR